MWFLILNNYINLAQPLMSYLKLSYLHKKLAQGIDLEKKSVNFIILFVFLSISH